MLNEKLRAELDQAKAGIVELLPSLWRELFLKSMMEGFTKEEALTLLHIYILSQCPSGVNGK